MSRERRGVALGAWSRHRRPRGRDGPARRRRRRRRHLVAVDLLAERARRPAPAPARDAAARVDRAGPGARPPGPRARRRRPARARVGPRPRERRRLGEPADRRCARGGRPPAGRLRRLGAAHAAADAPDALLPRPRVRGRERRVALHVLRDVRLDLPADAVLPDRAGLLAARVRPPRAPVDDHADVRRADRRRALGSHRRRAAHGDGARPAGGRASPGSPRSSTADVGYGVARRAVHPLRHRDGHVLRSGRERRPLGRRPRRRARRRAPTTRSARSAACSASPSSRRSSPAPAATSRRRRSTTVSCPRSGSVRPSSGAGALLALLIPPKKRAVEAPAAEVVHQLEAA